MAAELLCRYADWVATLSALGLHPLDAGDCLGEATHLASGQYRRPGVAVTVAAHVCVCTPSSPATRSRTSSPCRTPS
jgi:hypothetical protein